MNLKAEEVDTQEKRAAYKVGVVGCSQGGLAYAVAFADAGFKVTCADANQSVVRGVTKGNVFLGDRDEESKLKRFVRAEQIVATSDLKKAVVESDIVILAVSPKFGTKKTLSYTEVEGVYKQVGAILQSGSLVVYTGVAAVGLIGGLVRETLENMSGLKAGEDFGLAYIAAKNVKCLKDQELIVAADDKASLNAASVVFGTITKSGVKKILGSRTVELATLFAAVKRDLEIALANELAIFCENAGVDYAEIIAILNGGVPSPTITEEENRKEAYMLLESAENLNVKLRLPPLARQINEDMIRHVTNLVHEAMRNGTKTLRRAKIAFLGTVNSESAAAAFMKLLETKGAKVSIYDPQNAFNTLSEEEPQDRSKRTLNETVEGADCLVVLGGQEFKRLNLKKLNALMKSPAVLIDLAGIVEPRKAEEAGFTYRGLGRGVEKK